METACGARIDILKSRKRASISLPQDCRLITRLGDVLFARVCRMFIQAPQGLSCTEDNHFEHSLQCEGDLPDFMTVWTIIHHPGREACIPRAHMLVPCSEVQAQEIRLSKYDFLCRFFIPIHFRRCYLDCPSRLKLGTMQARQRHT